LIGHENAIFIAKFIKSAIKYDIHMLSC